MATTFIGLAIADGMFGENATVTRRPLSIDEARELIGAGVVSCCNPSHKTTLDALQTKFAITVPVPEKAPFVKLTIGDRVIVMSARFTRRLNEGETWTAEDVAKAEFKFGLWEVS